MSRAKGYRCRSAAKLEQLDDKYQFLSQAHTIVDLGSAPGGWSQVLGRRMQHSSRRLAVDLQEMAPLDGVQFILGDFMEPHVQEEIQKFSSTFDAIISDMAPSSTGLKGVDRLKMEGLLEEIWTFAANLLNPGGTLLVKSLAGGLPQAMIQQLRQSFTSWKHVKPPATYKNSSEHYGLGLGFRGVPAVPVGHKVEDKA